MNYNHLDRNNSAVSIRVMCAIVFVSFSLAWLYFQSDVLAMTQHVLSGGLTHYNPFLGALIITFVLFIFQQGVYALTRLKNRVHALTYVPSMLMLALLTEMSLKIDNGDNYHYPWQWFLLILLVWGLITFLAVKMKVVEKDSSFPLFSRLGWINILIMVIQMMLVAWLGNTNAVFHYRMQMESLLAKGAFSRAADVGRKSLESDANLLMLRMYALAHEDALGERLFVYPVTGSSCQMLPTNGQSRMLMCPVDSLYKYLGARPAEPMDPERYLKMLQRRDSVPRKTIADYLLCGYLIDKDLDHFVSEIGNYYTIDEHLPKHYREALTLYTHLRSNPIQVYQEPVMEEDYRNMKDIENHYSKKTERKGYVEKAYRGTYWFYYQYE